MTEFQEPGFTIIGNHLAQHSELSFLARGLATYIQSLPEGAPVDIRTLAQQSREGRDRIAAALRELEAYGYLERVRQRMPDGRIITVTNYYNNPKATRARRAREGARPARRKAVAPVSEEPAPAVPKAKPQPKPAPASPPAVALLANLRRHDPRLLLSVRDVHRLAPDVAAWLERGASPDDVRRALMTKLPEPIHQPAALIAHRLRELLPPPLAEPSAATRPHPWQTCDGCERAFRALVPGRCRDCRASEASEASAASEASEASAGHSGRSSPLATC
ncbi:helix-turn-helix domain-containing protein [Streptomyces sp. NPDC001339]|uniref:helix-turn-helix domain-containing protein n=1 Tax=Streptomyces sp. NPDC001339 TaxID=3364563 RepID=UPI00368C4517